MLAFVLAGTYPCHFLDFLGVVDVHRIGRAFLLKDFAERGHFLRVVVKNQSQFLAFCAESFDVGYSLLHLIDLLIEALNGS